MEQEVDVILRRVRCYRNVARVRADAMSCIAQVGGGWTGRAMSDAYMPACMLNNKGVPMIHDAPALASTLSLTPHDTNTPPRADQVRSLIPKIERLIHNNGMESELLVLAGTVPILHKGRQYNIPVEIYISEPYPDAPPRCYVRPTRDMEISPGHKHVDREVGALRVCVCMCL